MKDLDAYSLKRLILLCLILNIGFLAQAQNKSQSLRKIDPKLYELTKEVAPKLTPKLDTPKNARTAPQNDAQTFQPVTSPAQQVYVVNGQVLIEAIAVDNTQMLLGRLQALGLQSGAAFGGMVSGWFPVDSIEKLNEIAQLRFARPSMMKTNIGATTSQGDQAMFSDRARSQFKVIGRHNKIGVLSDSYNSLGGAPGGVASGDLPGDDNPNGYLHAIEVLEDLPAGAGIDEGRAMLEIIHDVAPASELAFHTAVGGQANFAQGIVDLANVGSNIIVDDIFYFAEPFFQDGIITQATDIVSNRGVAYFSSAGNSDRDSYESPFRPTSDTVTLPVEIVTPDTSFIAPSPYIFHDFDPGPAVDIYQEITFDQGLQSFLASVQWDEPFASVCEGCPGAKSDLDIFIALTESTETIVYPASSFFNNIDGDAVEVPFFQFESDSSNNTIQLLIGKYVEDPTLPDPNLIKYISFTNGSWEYATHSPTVVGHSNGKQVNSIGASFFFRNPLFFPEIYPLPLVNSFSSAGGSPILFTIEGSRIEPEMRVNPDVTGPDAGNTTFFFPGSFIGFEIPGTTEPDEFPQFAGTSASAPHVAAVAALMNEAAGEHLSPDRITEILSETATDLDDPFTEGFDEGYDVKTGFGYVNAQKAVASVFNLPSVVSFTLVNATTNEEIGPLGDRIELSLIEGGFVNVRADIIEGNGTVGSVLFDLMGPLTQEKTESALPYALFGDDNGDYNGADLPPGNYTLTATPFTNLRGEGEEGAGLTVNFEVTRFPIAQFVLIDADADQSIGSLTDGDEINLRSNPRLTVVAIPEFEDFEGSVKFMLNGELIQIENNAPYALAGNSQEDFNPFAFEPGEYTLTAIPYSEDRTGGVRGDSLTVRFRVIDEFEVTALVLVDASTGLDLGVLNDGAVLPLALLPPINVRAVVNDISVGSVEFKVNGEIINRDNDAPYLLLDSEDTDNLPPGVYQITAIPFSREDGLGTAGISLSILIRLDLNLAVTQFMLIDADKDEPIGELTTGDVLDISMLPPFNIKAMVSSDKIESVGFMLNGQRVKIDNSPPYVLGSSKEDDYEPLKLDTGAYVLLATPYSADDLKGTSGTAREIAFLVINSAMNDTLPPIAETATFRVYPNPVAKTLSVRTESQTDVIAHYTLIDNLGRQLISSQVRDLEKLEVDITPYLPQIGPSRLFFLKITTNQGKTATVRLRTE